MTKPYCTLLLLAPMLHPKMMQDLLNSANECSSLVVAEFHTNLSKLVVGAGQTIGDASDQQGHGQKHERQGLPVLLR